MTYRQPAADVDRSTYEQHRPVIDQVVTATSRYHRLAPDTAEEFRSFVWERLLESDILKRHQQRCSIRTFLTVVVRNLFRDFRNHRWGKWRPSAAARRLGPLAVRLEILTSRDGHSFDEAAQMLSVDTEEGVDRMTLDAIAARLPVRVRPRQVGEEPLASVAAASGGAEALVADDWLRARGREVRQALALALSALPGEDALILRLLFEDGFSIAQVAEALHLPQKPLYRRRDHILRELRARLEAAGISPAEVGELVGSLDEAPDGDAAHSLPAVPTGEPA